VSHMVIYRGSDGKPGYHQVDDIHDAVSFVEEMRNTEGVDHARIFRLEEVNFEFKPYYRVEIGGVAVNADAEDSSADDEPDSVVEIEAGSDSEEVDESANGQGDEEMADVGDDDDLEEDEGDEEAAGGARRGLFGR